MKPLFQPKLVNPPFSDPGLFIPFRFEKRALLFDLGDLHALSSRDLLKITHAFVTHTHMDHFIGFDMLLRIYLGRSKELYVFGPPGFFGHMEGKLSAYTWNLVHEYKENLSIIVNEVHDGKIITKTYVCRNQFKAKAIVHTEINKGILWDEPAFSVSGVLLDHKIPCLGLCLKESLYVNIIKQALVDLGLPTGPWLTRFKKAIYEKQDPDTPFYVTWEQNGRVIREKKFLLGQLVEKIAKISKGKKIGYITDVIGSKENEEKIVELVKDADILFMEAPFLEQDRDMAERKFHLTAAQAGKIARKANVKHLRVFHFSPRYEGNGEVLEKEAMEAFKKQ